MLGYKIILQRIKIFLTVQSCIEHNIAKDERQAFQMVFECLKNDCDRGYYNKEISKAYNSYRKFKSIIKNQYQLGVKFTEFHKIKPYKRVLKQLLKRKRNK